MKKNIIIKLLCILIAGAMFSGCDKFPLQKNFKYDGEALDPHVNMTALEWLRSQGDKFSQMLAAIERAEMEDYYQQTDTRYTFLIIDNASLSSWAGGEMKYVDKERVRNLLKYHIIKGQYSAYDKETPVEAVFVKNLISGEDGLITLRCAKSSYPIYGTVTTSGNIIVNTTGSNGSSVQRSSYASNYITTNGVMHFYTHYTVYKRDGSYTTLF